MYFYNDDKPAVPFGRVWLVERCSRYLNMIRDRAGVNGKTGEFKFDLDFSFYARYFSPQGFTKGSPKDYLKKLDEIFVVKVSFLGFVCEGPLVFSKILFLYTTLSA